MKKNLIALLFFLFIISLHTAKALPVEGVVFIDNFGDDTVGDWLGWGVDGQVFTGEITALSAASSDFSTSRTIAVSKNPSSDFLVSHAQVVNNELKTVTNPGVSSTNTLSYANIGGFDLTLGRAYQPRLEGFFLDVTAINAGGANIDLTVDGEQVTKFVDTISQVFFNKSEFSTVDFTDVQSIIVSIRNTSGVDTTFDFVEYGFIPEPASLVLFSAGLIGFGFVRRKKVS